MKKYAVYEYDRTKEGFEQYKFLYNVETNEPNYFAGEIFLEHYNSQKITAKSYDMKIKINNIHYNGFAVAFNGTNKEIILAEIIKSKN